MPYRTREAMPLIVPRFNNRSCWVEQMSTDALGAGRVSNTARGRISLSAFLYLAMVCFVSPKEPPEDSQEQDKPPRLQSRPATATGPGGRRLFVRGLGQNGDGGGLRGSGGGGDDGDRECPRDLDCAAVGGPGDCVSALPRSSPLTSASQKASRRAAASAGGGGGRKNVTLFDGSHGATSGAGERGFAFPVSVSPCPLCVVWLLVAFEGASVSLDNEQLVSSRHGCHERRIFGSLA